MPTTYENILVELSSPLARITLNRPERRNALSLGLMQELLDCLKQLSQSREVGAIILAAAGNVFSSGHDLNELRGRTLSDYRQLFDVCAELMTTLQRIPQPVIAEVQGMATAAGCQLVATCDLAIAVETAKFATPGVRIGLFCSTPMVALTRAVGRKRALEMLMTGAPIDSKTAADWGLINRAVPAAELRAETEKLAIQISTASPLTLGIGKQVF
ncbi:MAG: enoyl-CoA hydratase-related protein, partial [Blastocatellia bacterium]